MAEPVLSASPFQGSWAFLEASWRSNKASLRRKAIMVASDQISTFFRKISHHGQERLFLPQGGRSPHSPGYLWFSFVTPTRCAQIGNRIKAKGLQKLRWYCQLCQKQCRDENGFKCHQVGRMGMQAHMDA